MEREKESGKRSYGGVNARKPESKSEKATPMKNRIPILAVAFLAETLSVFQLLALALICSTVLIEMIVKTRI